MKRSQIILLGIFLFISGAMYMPILMNAKEYEKQTKKENKTVNVPTAIVINELHKIPMSSYGQVAPNTELLVSFEVQGKLQQGDQRLKPGVSFRSGSILYRIDGQAAAYSLFARHMSLASIITQALPDLALDMPEEKDKWDQFLVGLTSLRSDIPAFPKLNTRKEKQFWTVRNVLTEYFNIIAQDNRLKKYEYIAPFSGTVTEVYSEPGSIVNPGVQIAKIARTGEFELKVPVSLEDLKMYKEQKTARFKDPNGKLIATGSIIRVSDVINQRTQSADVYYSVKPEEGERVYNGLYLNVEIDFISNEKTVALPRRAVKDRKVLVLKGDKLTYVDVKQVSRKPDTVYVTGIQDGQRVVTEQVGAPNKDMIYKPVESEEKK